MSSARIEFVTGKGGVGKTTIAAALALSAAKHRGRALLVQVEDGRAAVRTLGDARDVHVVTVTHKQAMQDAITRMLYARILAKAIVNQRSVSRLLDTVPAIRELVVLEAVRALAEANPDAGIVVDLPATGHAVDFLRVPAAAKRFLQHGPAARMCDEILEQVLTPSQCRIVVVSTFEPVVARETRELCQRLKDDLGLSAKLIVMNRTPAALPPAAADALVAAAASPELAEVLVRARSRIAAWQEAEESRRVLGGFAPVTLVPDFGLDPTAAEVAQELAR